jgi:hypothetical protein
MCEKAANQVNDFATSAMAYFRQAAVDRWLNEVASVLRREAGAAC